MSLIWIFNYCYYGQLIWTNIIKITFNNNKRIWFMRRSCLRDTFFGVGSIKVQENDKAYWKRQSSFLTRLVIYSKWLTFCKFKAEKS